MRMRRSTDFGITWQAPVAQPFPVGWVPTVVWDEKANVLTSVGLCRWPPNASKASAAAALLRPDNKANCTSTLDATCSWKSSDDGLTWAGPTSVGSFGHVEGCGGTALSASGTILAGAGLPNCSSTSPSFAAALISSDGGRHWQRGGPTPRLPSGQGWGECSIAELANGSVVLTSRLGQSVAKGAHWAPIQQAFAISHDGGQHWDKAWSFPAAQPFDVGCGPGYNVNHGLASAKNKTWLLMSKPTANLHGDAGGQNGIFNCSRHTQGSCTYRRNLTIPMSSDGGASWKIEPWGLVYAGRVAYSDLTELPDGKIAVVFERGSPVEEYRHLSVAIVSPPWAAEAL